MARNISDSRWKSTAGSRRFDKNVESPSTPSETARRETARLSWNPPPFLAKWERGPFPTLDIKLGTIFVKITAVNWKEVDHCQRILFWQKDGPYGLGRILDGLRRIQWSVPGLRTPEQTLSHCWFDIKMTQHGFDSRENHPGSYIQKSQVYNLSDVCSEGRDRGSCLLCYSYWMAWLWTKWNLSGCLQCWHTPGSTCDRPHPWCHHGCQLMVALVPFIQVIWIGRGQPAPKWARICLALCKQSLTSVSE
jgi:hypothetical protein